MNSVGFASGGTRGPAPYGGSKRPSFDFWKSHVDRTLTEQRDELLREERVAENARNDGRQNLPGSTAIEPAVTEQRITERAALNLRSIYEALKKEMRQRALTIAGLSVAATRMRLKELPASAEFDIKKLFADSRDDLVRANTEARLRERDLLHFQRENELHRMASYPRDSVKPWMWCFLGLVALVEAALNAHFWAPVNEYGLVGGFLKAGFVAMVNLVPAVLIGIYIVPKMGHFNKRTAAQARHALFIWICWTAFYNLFIGHWRVTAEAGAESMRAAANSMLAHPVAGLLASGDAVMLVVAGVIAAIVAGIDAFALDDRYAGYGHVARRYAKAQVAFDSHMKGLRQRLADIVLRYGNEAGNVVADAPRHIQQINGLIAEAAQFREEAHNSADVLQGVLESALKVYRDENRRVRTAPAPAYFSTYPLLQRPDLDALVDGAARERQRFVEDIGQLAPLAAKVKTDLLRVADEQLHALKQLLDDVENEGERRFAAGSAVTSLPARVE